ncbi:MAG: hypothetical protein AB1546_13715 [bacterium]
MRKIIFTVILLFIFTSGFLYSLLIPPWKARFIQQLTTQIQAVSHLRIQINKTGFHLPATITLKDFSAITKDLPRQLIFSSSEIRVRLNIISLFRGKAKPESVVFYSPSLYIVRDEEGKLNVADLISTKEDLFALFPIVKVSGGRIDFVDYYESADSVHHRFFIDRATLKYLKDQSVSIQSPVMKYEKSRFALNGKIPIHRGDNSLAVTSDHFPTEDALKLLSIFNRTEVYRYKDIAFGTMSLNIRLTEKQGNERVEGEILMPQGKLLNYKTGKCRAKFTLERDGSLNIDEVGIRLEEKGLLLASGKFSTRGNQPFSLKAHLENFPINLFTLWLDETYPLKSGNASADLMLSGQYKKPESYSGSGEINLVNFALPSVKKGLQPISLDAASARFTIQKGVAISQKCNIRMKGLKMELSGKVMPDESLSLTGSAKVRKMELDDNSIKEVLEPLLKEKDREYSLRVEIGGTLSAPILDFKLTR